MVGDASKLPAVLKALKKFKGQLKGIAYWGTATPDVVKVSTCVLYCPCTQKVPAAFVDLWQRGGGEGGHAATVHTGPRSCWHQNKWERNIPAPPRPYCSAVNQYKELDVGYASLTGCSGSLSSSTM